LQNLRPVERHQAYAADITYGTNNEFGFDYLRDNMVSDAKQLVQRELAYAIVDEVDSILIDEARTPLIISAPSSDSAHYYKEFAKHVKALKPETDFVVDEKARSVALTDQGIKKLESAVGVSNLYDPANAQLVHYADTSLKAYALYKKNRDYVVKDGQIIIVDEFTGRLLHGRRYSSGLHQAIEAKEDVTVQEESVTLATITFQNYFRLYFKLAGMTGTAATEAEEFSKIYHLEVVSIPTNRPSQRRDLPDAVYKTERAKFEAVANLVSELQQRGQPVLIGTVSIAKSEALSKLLKSRKIEHRVLNAKFHQKEGEIIAQAGLPGSVTVATNMAGRGVDIVLGGAPPSADAPKEEFMAWERRHQQVLESGGLYVIGTERHESRRIDNQLRGRAGRQGDPGVSQFFVSMEDDLMRIFGGDRMKAIMERLNIPEDLSINNKLLSRAIEQAQSRVEAHNFDIRKQLVEYDDVMNKHREAIYRRRERIVRLTFSDEAATELHQELIELFEKDQQQIFESRSKEWGAQLRFEVERAVVLRAIDVLWVEHLKNLEDLRESIGLQAYGQREPLVEYKQQAYRIFSELQAEINRQIVEMLLHVNVDVAPSDNMIGRKVEYNKQEAMTPSQNQAKKVGRNDPCPCGAIDPKTGKVYKYKKCGLINAPHHRQY
jgi:preprotein translocase subunit SecA